MIKDVFPLKTKRPSITTTNEPTAKRCKWCGWPCDTVNTAQGNGVNGELVLNEDDENDTYYQNDITAGCPYCGNLNWNK